MGKEKHLLIQMKGRAKAPGEGSGFAFRLFRVSRKGMNTNKISFLVHLTRLVGSWWLKTG